MRGRGKARRGKHQNSGRGKPTKFRGRNRKTYSLYQNSGGSKSTVQKSTVKRKHDNDYAVESEKRYKTEPTQPLVPPSSEEEEEEDDMKQLMSTFGGVSKRSVAIESSSDSEVEDEELLDPDDDSNSDDEKIEEEITPLDKDSEIASEDESDEEISLECGEEETEEDKNENDPFVKHILYDLNDSLLDSLQTVPKNVDKSEESWPLLGRLLLEIPKCENSKLEKAEFSIAEEKNFAPGGVKPVRIHSSKTGLKGLCIKSQISGNVAKANKAFAGENCKLPLTLLQCELFAVLNNYQDLFYPHRSFKNAEEIRFAYCLHSVNHILKTRMKVVHHNARLSKKDKDDVPEDFRDQGLVRPKILIIVPFRDAAYRIINMLIDILLKEDKGNVINKNRFISEFTGAELIMPKKNPKPEDYETLFSGNSSDDFKIGITVTKKSLKLYANFYSSDIIIASPLGLRYIIGADGEADRDFDFLASIELLIVDQAEIFLMQNWDHLLHVFSHLHLQPKESHGTDFSRVRTWSLNGWAKYYRQTLIFSSLVLPEINSIFNKQCQNYAGKVRVCNPEQYGSIRQVYVQTPHVFQKFETHEVSHSIEARFNFFTTKVLPQQKDALMKQTLIYVANYFDYVRLRNYFKKEDVGFVQICEYSKDAKIARARDMFFHGDAHFMLYTERYHFFNRKRIKGIRHLIFYQPPNFPHFYFELCNLMQEGNMNKKIGSAANMTVTVLYSKYDVHQLAAIVGTERAVKMISSDRNVHMLLTGDKD